MKADLSADGRRIEVTFQYSEALVRAAREIPGGRFVPASKGGPAWAYPLNMKTARMLRESFGFGLRFSAELLAWGRHEKHRTGQLRAMSSADDADLYVLPTCHRELFEFISSGPGDSGTYQRADVAMMARQSLINANEMGLGKTTEVIAATIEANLLAGRHLVIAPVTSLYPVWVEEISRWYPSEILCGETPKERRAAIEKAGGLSKSGVPFWLVINPEMIRIDSNGKAENPALFDIEFDTVTIDEFHRMGLSNPNTAGSRGAGKIQTAHKWALSGTPMGGQPIRLWGALHWLDPKQFSSKWQWAEQWLEITSNGFGLNIGQIRPGREDEFYLYHAPWILRRTKADCLKNLPPKQYVDIWCKMSRLQAKQYEKFERDAEIKIDEERLTGTSILAEYQYLKQFASAKQKLVDGVLWPTEDSGKITALVDQLQRRDGESALVVTQSSKMAALVTRILHEKGLDVALIAGSVKQKERTEIVRGFQNDGSPKVIVLVTAAGGVSLTLNRADSVHILDETWNPDDQLQAEDRAHRGNRTETVTIYYYRTRGTIEEKIESLTKTKRITSSNILDIRRQHWQ